MNAQQVRRHASSYGFTLVVDQERRLHAKGNAKSMTPELRGLIEVYRDDLIEEVLATKQEQPSEPPPTLDDVAKWFFAFAKSEPGGVRLFRGELVDVWKEHKRLLAKAAEIAEDYDLQAQWLDDARYLRAAVEYGRPQDWPEEIDPKEI
jgi:hypothetical protein